MAMKFPIYSNYKPSGVEWLGDVPEHWEIKKMRYLVTLETGDKDTVNAVVDGDYPFYVRSQIVERIDTFTSDCEAVLTAGDGVGVGKVFHHHLGGRFDFHQRVYMMCKFRKVIGRFFFYFLREQFYKVALEGSAKSTVDSLRRPLIMDFQFAVPPLPEQKAIAAYLDRETVRLDALLEKKRELIDRLKEKRNALISRTVTHGLPASTRATGLSAPHSLKPSGLDWVGDIPAHWEIRAFRHLISKFEQGTSPNANNSPAAPGELGVLKLGAANKGVFRPEDNKSLDEIPGNIAPIFPQCGDLLISRANTPDLVGDACVVDVGCPNLIIPDLMYRLVLNNHANVKYICWFLLSTSGRAQIESDARGSSGSMVKIGQGHVAAWLMPLPPLPEQIAIAAYLDKETAKLDALMGKVEEAMERLLEYRSTLITAAVTGKIDVREAKSV